MLAKDNRSELKNECKGFGLLSGTEEDCSSGLSVVQKSIIHLVVRQDSLVGYKFLIATVVETLSPDEITSIWKQRYLSTSSSLRTRHSHSMMDDGLFLLPSIPVKGHAWIGRDCYGKGSLLPSVFQGLPAFRQPRPKSILGPASNFYHYRGRGQRKSK